MRTNLDCLICFMRQARSLGLRASNDPGMQRQLLNEAGQFIASVNADLAPPENSGRLYPLLAKTLGIPDPFIQVKEESNTFALALREEIRQRIIQAEDPLQAAVRAAIGGNIIDYGSLHDFDAAETMQTCFEQEFVIDDVSALQEAVRKKGQEVTAVVRDAPIINDATLVDAQACGLDKLCPVISSGTSCPGTPLSQCNPEFLARFQAADIIISKGMGNFESLSEVAAPIFFLFTVKCTEVARHLVAQRQLATGLLQGKGEMVLLRQQL